MYARPYIKLDFFTSGLLLSTLNYTIVIPILKNTNKIITNYMPFITYIK